MIDRSLHILLIIEKIFLKPRVFQQTDIRSTNRSILYVDGNTDIKKYPNAEKWLLPHKKDLGERRECKRGVIPWYSLQWPRGKSQLDLIPKILVQAIRNPRLKTRVLATIDEIGIYGTQGLNYIIPRSESASVYFLIGILNSTLINFLYATKFLNVAIKAEYLKDTPIPQATKEQEEKIENFVKKIFAITNNCENYSDNPEEQAEVLKYEKQIDQMVYGLYGLTKNEIGTIENK